MNAHLEIVHRCSRHVQIITAVTFSVLYLFTFTDCAERTGLWCRNYWDNNIYEHHIEILNSKDVK